MNYDLFKDRADIWRGGRTPSAIGQCVPTGFACLDQLLPGGGWPQGALTEILFSEQGSGALRLTVPALAHLSSKESWVAWVSPPHIPYAPALSELGIDLSKMLFIHARSPGDKLWALEQALKSGTCSAVLGWLDKADNKTLRRLQLAAEKGGAIGVLFRPEHAARQRSTAALRLRVSRRPNEVTVDVLKSRGNCSGNRVRISIEQNAALPRQH